MNKAPFRTGLRTIQPTAQPHQRKILENPQEEVLSIPFPSFQKFQVPPPHVSQPTPALELLPDANKDPSKAKRDRYRVIAARDASQLLPRRNL